MSWFPTCDKCKSEGDTLIINDDELCRSCAESLVDRLTAKVEQLKKELTQKDKAIEKAVDLFLLLGKCPKWFGKCENHECNDVSSPAEQRKQCWREYLTGDPQ